MVCVTSAVTQPAGAHLQMHKWSVHTCMVPWSWRLGKLPAALPAEPLTLQPSTVFCASQTFPAFQIFFFVPRAAQPKYFLQPPQQLPSRYQFLQSKTFSPQFSTIILLRCPRRSLVPFTLSSCLVAQGRSLTPPPPRAEVSFQDRRQLFAWSRVALISLPAVRPCR